MARKRIIAHFMHETERDAAAPMMTAVHRTDSYLVGEIDEYDIPPLEKQGLIIQVLEAAPEPETPGAERTPARGIRLASARRRMFAAAVAPPAQVDPTKPNFYVLTLRGPLLAEWRKALEQLQVELLEYLPRDTYTVRLRPDRLSAVSALSFVSALRPYNPEDTGPLVLTREAAAPPGAAPPARGAAMLTFDIRLHRAEDLPEVRQWLEHHGVSIAGASGRKIRVYLLEGSPFAHEIAALPEVAVIEQYVQPQLHNNFARKLLGIHAAVDGATPGASLPQTGHGQIVGVADTGLDASHPDFQNRVCGLVALGRPNDPSDPHGHGTHVAGSVLGDGSASGGRIRGAAPGAQLFFQSLLDAAGGLGGLPLILGDLFEEAYQAGARIHNNSWGAVVGSEYTLNSLEVDEFVAKRRDMLIVISAGNEGQAATCTHSKPGFVDWLSIGAPASSKNALTVGASRSDRTADGLAALTYQQVWPKDFPDAPIAAQTVSGDPEALAAFSSRGPCTDRRIKPDLVAPGTDIASAKSSRAALRQFWGPYPGNSRYAFMGGTSMAAPLVAGCAALAREYYVTDRAHEPSAALLKATLINSTRWLQAPDAVADHPDLPNFHQGFGCVYMPWAIPNPRVPKLRLEFRDAWKDSTKHFTITGQRFRYRVSVAGGEWLRVCLTWTDLPARALQNNLDLFVQHLPSSRKWMGNEHLPLRLVLPDPENNIELVRISNPQPGDYLIQVSATNLLQAGQDFALVVTGELVPPLSDF